MSTPDTPAPESVPPTDAPAAPPTGPVQAPAPRAARFRPAGLVLTVVGVVLGLLLVANGAWSFVAYSVGTWHHTAHTEAVAPVVSLVAEGDVEVTVDPSATQVSVQADAWYAWSWQAPTYQATVSGNRLEVRHECRSFPASPACEARLHVVLPPRTQLRVTSTNGHVVASGLDGPVDVSSSDGRLELSHIVGDVTAHSGNGRVDVTAVTGSVTATSADGAVAVDGVDGDVVEARSGSGRVEVSNVTGSASVTSSDGAVTVSGVGGDVVTARSGNGRVDVSDVHGSATVSSSDGAVVVNTVDGDVDARSGNGRVEVVSVAGSATATSSDGAVLVEDVLGNVTARSGNGSVTVYGQGVPVALDISSGNGHQTIQAPTDPAAKTTVTIRSSDGNGSYLPPRAPSRVAVTVPDVVGMTRQDAQAALENAGLGVTVSEAGSAGVADNQVLRTDPPAGQSVARGTVVTVVVAAAAG